MKEKKREILWRNYNTETSEYSEARETIRKIQKDLN